MSVMDEEKRREELRGAVAGLPEEVVRDALVLSLTNNSVPAQSAEEKNLETEKFADIFELVAYLKRSYTFPELDKLAIEGGKLLFKDGDRRIVMAEKNYSIDTMTGGSPSHRSVSPPTKPDSGAPGPVSSEGPERFSRLELDD